MHASHWLGAVLASTALLICPNALAGSMAATPITIDTAVAPDVVVLPDINVTLGNTLRYQDGIVIRVAGATTLGVDVGALPGLVSCPGYPSAVGYLNNGPDSWNFRVTTFELPSGLTCTFHGLPIAKSGIGDNCQVTSSYEANPFNSGPILDSAGPITVVNVSSCGPPPPIIVNIPAASIASATDVGPQDGSFDEYVRQLSVNNNGYTSLATAFEFDLSAIPAGAQIDMAVLGALVNADEGPRQVAVSAYAGDGTVSLPDFAAGTLVERQIIAANMPNIFVDVTSMVDGWLLASTAFGGFNLREDPANCCSYTVMGVDGQPYFPALYVAYRMPPVLPVGIDIRPGTEPNSLNLRSKGQVPVAILSDASLYAPTDVVVESLRFGHDGTETSLLKCVGPTVDVNLDGLVDLVCHFDTQLAGFQPGDIEGLLSVETIGGLKLQGRDSIRIVP